MALIFWCGAFVSLVLVLIVRATWGFTKTSEAFWYGCLTMIIVDSLIYRIFGAKVHWFVTRHDLGFFSNKVCIVLGIICLLCVIVRMIQLKKK